MPDPHLNDRHPQPPTVPAATPQGSGAQPEAAGPHHGPRPHLLVRLGLVFAGGSLIWGLVIALNATVLTDLSIPVRFANAAIVCALAVPLVIAARRYLDRRPWAGLGLGPVREAGRPLLIGVAAFLIPSALGLGTALLAGWVELSLEVPVSHVLGWVALLLVLVFLYEALPEELLYRGYLQRNLTTVLRPWVAAIVQALLFATWGTALWVITSGWGVLVERGSMFFGMAVVIGLLRVQTGSVWTAVGFHLAFQVVAQNLLSERFASSSETALMVAAMLVPFALATTVVGVLHRKDVNWSTPEPE